MCSLSEVVKCIQVVGRGVLWSAACMVKRWVSVQRWVESVEEQLAEECVKYGLQHLSTD